MMFIGTARLVDPGWEHWFPMPGELATRDIALPATIHEFEGYVPSNFSQVLARALRSTLNRLDFHTMQHHTRVVARGKRLLGALSAAGFAWPIGLVEAVLFAMAIHDLCHPGAKFWQHARFDRIPVVPGIKEMTVEEYTALRADELAREVGFTIHQRLLIQYLIRSSIWDPGSELGRQFRLDRIKVRGVLGVAMRVCDALPPEDPADAVNQDVAATYGERNATEPPGDLDAYIEARNVFLDYVGTQLRLLDRAAGAPVAERLEWHARVAGYRSAVDAFRRSDVERAMLAAELAQRGYALRDDGLIVFEGLPKPARHTRTVAVLCTGVENAPYSFGSTADEIHASKDEHVGLVERVVSAEGGTPVKRTGDGVAGIFASVVDAVTCARRLQVESDHPLSIGLDHGAVSVTEDDIAGWPVRGAAELCKAARAGQVLVPIEFRPESDAFAFGSVLSVGNHLRARELLGPGDRPS